MSAPNASKFFLPEQGDIVWLDLNPRTGHEQSGRRPAIVLSPRLLVERTGLAVICPITTKIKGLPFEITLKNTKTQGAVLPIHIRSVDVMARRAQFIERASSEVTQAVILRVEALLGR